MEGGLLKISVLGFVALVAYMAMAVAGEIGTCPSEEWSEFENNCYLFSNLSDRLPFDDAKSKCVEYGGLLTSINTEAENNFIFENKKDRGVDAWIGLSLPDSEWFDGTDYTYSKWAAFHGGDSTRPCIRMGTSSNLWYDNNCENAYGYICKAPKVSADINDGTPWQKSGSGHACDPHWLEKGKNCYKWVHEDALHDEARTHCEHLGGELAMPHKLKWVKWMGRVIAQIDPTHSIPGWHLGGGPGTSYKWYNGKTVKTALWYPDGVQPAFPSADSIVILQRATDGTVGLITKPKDNVYELFFICQKAAVKE